MTNSERDRILRDAKHDIRSLEKQQRSIFSRTLRKLKVKPKGLNSNILFDLLYNKEYEINEVVKRIWPTLPTKRRRGKGGPPTVASWGT